MAGSGAVAGLCPITEANLGDGMFDAPRFLAAGGRFGIGSDSNVLIGVADELRQLEYSQRLAHRCPQRAGRRWRLDRPRPVRRSGRGRAQPRWAPTLRHLRQGAPADCVALDAVHPALAGRADDGLLDSWIFAAGNGAIDCVWVRGGKQVSNGRHHAREAVYARFRAATERMAAR